MTQNLSSDTIELIFPRHSMHSQHTQFIIIETIYAFYAPAYFSLSLSTTHNSAIGLNQLSKMHPSAFPWDCTETLSNAIWTHSTNISPDEYALIEVISQRSFNDTNVSQLKYSQHFITQQKCVEFCDQFIFRFFVNWTKKMRTTIDDTRGWQHIDGNFRSW